LIASPRLVLADEPTAGLDIKRSHEIMDLLQEMAVTQGIGLLVVSHEPQIVDRFDNVLRLGVEL
jgi:putative ABC transport system ATP-binding protein